MVAAEALIIGALLTSMARRWIPLRFEECSQAFGVVGKEIGSTASSANGCFGAVDLFIMVVTMGTATLLAASWWRWRRWNKRHA